MENRVPNISMKLNSWKVTFLSIILTFTTGLMPGGALSAQKYAVFSHGPILGRIGAHEIGVWARTVRPGTFWVRYGTDPNNLDQLSDPVTTSVDHDNTGWVLIQGLEANTKYYYMLTAKGGTASMLPRQGSFRTLPDAEEMKDPEINPEGLFNFSFEYACGNNQLNYAFGTSLPTFRTMIDEISDKINFAILNGDWLYEDKRDYPVESWHKQVGISTNETPEVVKYMPKITGVWENYKSYLSMGHNLSEWHKIVPSWYTIDDHEIFNNTYGCGEIGRVNHKVVYRDVAVQAWHDYLAWSNPTEFTQAIHYGRARLKAKSDILSDKEADFTKLDLAQVATLHDHWGGPYDGMQVIPAGEKPGNPNSGVYEIVEVIDAHNVRINPTPRKNGNPVYSIGRRSYGKKSISNSDIFLLDIRSHQDMHEYGNPYKPGISIMGKEQKEWLKNEMAASDADFFFIVSSVNFTIPHEGGTGGSTPDKKTAPTGRDDAWTSYIEERNEMIAFWESLGKPVFLLTGDLHNSFAVQVTENIWEFASGPHNSQNHSLRSEGNRPVNGPFKSKDRDVYIKWSTAIMNDVPPRLRYTPSYCVVQVNNVFNNPVEEGKDRWIPFPVPHVIFQYYNGLTGELRYSETIHATRTFPSESL